MFCLSWGGWFPGEEEGESMQHRLGDASEQGTWMYPPFSVPGAGWVLVGSVDGGGAEGSLQKRRREAETLSGGGDPDSIRILLFTTSENENSFYCYRFDGNKKELVFCLLLSGSLKVP